MFVFVSNFEEIFWPQFWRLVLCKKNRIHIHKFLVLSVTIRSAEDRRENNDILKIVPTNARPGCIIFLLILSHVFFFERQAGRRWFETDSGQNAWSCVWCGQFFTSVYVVVIEKLVWKFLASCSLYHITHTRKHQHQQCVCVRLCDFSQMWPLKITSSGKFVLLPFFCQDLLSLEQNENADLRMTHDGPACKQIITTRGMFKTVIVPLKGFVRKKSRDSAENLQNIQ